MKEIVYVEPYRYFKVFGEVFVFEDDRDNMNNIFGERKFGIANSDFCEVKNDIQFDFFNGKLTAVSVPSRFIVSIKDELLENDFQTISKKLKKRFSDVEEFKAKRSICSDEIGLVCINQCERAKIILCSADYYKKFRNMLFIMEKCENKKR